MDFGDLRRLINSEIIDKYDHSLLVNDSISEDQKKNIEAVTERIVYLKYQPTCENMVRDFVLRIVNKLPEGVNLQSLRLYETQTSYAEWVAEDNN